MTDEAANGMDQAMQALAHLNEQGIVLPDQFAAPHKMPVHVDTDVAHDDRGTGWVTMRIETVHGSHIVFITPELADRVGKRLLDLAPKARLTVMQMGTGIVDCVRCLRKEQPYGMTMWFDTRAYDGEALCITCWDDLKEELFHMLFAHDEFEHRIFPPFQRNT